MSGGLVDILAEAAARTRFDVAPSDVRERAEFLVADVLATGVSGGARRDVTAMRRAAGMGDGAATLIGEGRGVPAATAAYCNALGVAAEQLQDGHRLAKGHPASHLVPVLLALGEETGADGEAFMSAMLAGYELGVRIGIAMGGTPVGVHDIGTWALVGATAAGAYLVSGGEASVIGSAIRIAAAAPQAFDAETVFRGRSASHLALASACQSAVMATYAALAGFDAEEDVLERHWLAHSAANFDPQAILASLKPDGSWKDYLITGGYIKIHPACAHLHGAIDAAVSLLDDERIDPNEVEDVVVETYAGAAAFDDPAPGDDLRARFSLPYVVASALANGRLDEACIPEGGISDSAAAGLAKRVRVSATPEMEGGYPAGRPARVEVHLLSGRKLRGGWFVPRGDGPEALLDPEVRSKPRRLLQASVGQELADGLLAEVAALAQGGSLAPLSVALRRVRLG
jgi:2-methylcitrate dehydratase PrpD